MKKNTQYSGQMKKNTRYSGQMKKNTQYGGQKKNTRYSGQMKDLIGLACPLWTKSGETYIGLWVMRYKGNCVQLSGLNEIEGK